MSKYAREEKLEMIRQYREEHRSIEWISKEYGISQSYLREILKKSQNGETAEIGIGKRGVPLKRHTGEFKLSVVEEKLGSNIGYRELGRKYGINHVVIMQWERVYLTQGKEGLLEEQRGRATKESSPKVGRPRKSPERSIEKDLIAEVQQLRMENEYLKKLQALVKEGKRSPRK